MSQVSKKKDKISEMKNYYKMQSFTLKNIPDLDVCVLGALELFNREKIPGIKIPYKRPLVVGSGNAEATGRIVFGDRDAVFASESTYENKLKNIKNIDGVMIVSASGSKHAPIIARGSKKYKKNISLMTNNPKSETKKYIKNNKLSEEYVFPKQREPYTYNTSTYLGMILGKTKEDPEDIYDFIKRDIDKMRFPDFSKYDKFFLIIPPEFGVGIKRMLGVKFIELFGRRIAYSVETSEYIKHATTVVPSKELFISFGEKNEGYGKKGDRLFVPLPKNVGFGGMMAISYYVIGKIQKAHPPYFKRNIGEYVKDASKVFGSEIKAIVE